MKKQPRHLIFLPKSNRLSLRGEGRATLSARRTVPGPQPSLATKGWREGPTKPLACNTRRLSSRPLPAKGFLSVLSLNPHDRPPGEVTKSAPSYG